MMEMDRAQPRARRTVCRLVLCVLASGAFVAGLPAAASAAYPERPIKLVVPFAPGGANDLIARILSVPLGQALGQTIVIENRGGANGNIGISAVARAEADGYTILLASNTFEVNPALSRQPSYDALKDFVPISDLAAAPNVIATRPDTGLKTFADLVARARARPDELNFATPGAGSISHLGAELLKLRANISMVHVPFTGAGPAMQALLGGTVQLCGVTVATAVPQVKVGAVLALVQTGRERWVDLPDVPTLADAGVPNSDSETYWSLYAPAGTPKPIVERLAKEVVEILRRPEIRERLAAANFRVLGTGPEISGARLAQDAATWREVITKAGIKID
jgi:tripartite-type tricarboxylate transporter receptor subunit TctC